MRVGEGGRCCACVREAYPEVVDTQDVWVRVWVCYVGEGAGCCTCVREVSPEVVDTQGV